jgi:Holliday junction resolvase RusA-like endonuclease
VTTASITYPHKPSTINSERAGNRHTRARNTKEWRQAFAYLARLQGIPTLTSCIVTATPYQKSGRLQDVAACVPAVKAAIDGLTDAGVFIDDSPDHVVAVVFRQPIRGEPALTIGLEGVLLNG